jgi:RsiW-degrading membrane proteinase PrsW (M82 family)
MALVSIAIAPVLIILLYIYLRDKYEKEPFIIMALALASGCFITLPVIYAERFISMGSMVFPGYWNVGYTAFVEAALTEEVFKFLAFMLLIWGNRNFNEEFDGQVPLYRRMPFSE